MAQFVSADDKTFTAGEALSMHTLVAIDKASTDKPIAVKGCEAHEDPVGVAFAYAASGDPVTVRILRQYATFPVLAGGAISKGAKVYRGPDGSVYAYGCRGAIGIALTAASASGDVIEVFYDPIPDASDEDLNYINIDFSHYVDGDQLTKIDNDSAAACAVADGAPAKFTMTNGANDNDQVSIAGTYEHFKFAASKPIWFRGIVKQTEANTDDANIFVGLTDGAADDLLQDDGAGVKASGSIMAVVKYDGDTVMKGVVSDAAEQQADTNIGALSGGSWVTFEMVWWPTSATAQTLDFYRDGVNGGQVGDSMTDYTSATDMQLVVSIKNGGGNAETIYVRKLEAAQFV